MKHTGLQSLIYPTKNIDEDKKWWTKILGVGPYFEAPEYVGFSINGYELGLHSKSKFEDGQVTYIGVGDVAEAVKHYEANDCTVYSEPGEVGGGIIMAVVQRADKQLVGLIYNPMFKIENS